MEFDLKILFYLYLDCWNIPITESYPDAANIFSATTGTTSATATATAATEPATAAAAKSTAANATGIDSLLNVWNLFSIFAS
jgi:hypothetical protein